MDFGLCVLESQLVHNEMLGSHTETFRPPKTLELLKSVSQSVDQTHMGSEVKLVPAYKLTMRPCSESSPLVWLVSQHRDVKVVGLNAQSVNALNCCVGIALPAIPSKEKQMLTASNLSAFANLFQSAVKLLVEGHNLRFVWILTTNTRMHLETCPRGSLELLQLLVLEFHRLVDHAVNKPISTTRGSLQALLETRPQCWPGMWENILDELLNGGWRARIAQRSKTPWRHRPCCLEILIWQAHTHCP